MIQFLKDHESISEAMKEFLFGPAMAGKLPGLGKWMMIYLV
jgi:hypothetical protein